MLLISPFVFQNKSWAWTIATVVAVIETVNGIGHIGAAIAVRGYFSGCIAAVGLLIFSIPIWSRKRLVRKETR